MISIAFLIASLILLILAALSVPAGNVSLGWAGMACLVASFLIGRV